MLDGLFIASLIGACYRLIKESCETTIPAENWANKKLYYNDLMSGVSVEQRMKNLKNGKYRLTESHPEPHRDTVGGKIVIENCKQYNEDLSKYGSSQTMKWVEQGKYNLTPEELKKEHKRIEEDFKRRHNLI